MLQPGIVVDGRYEVEALVGEGGLAQVYRVRHVDLGSLHALKVLMWRRKQLMDRMVLEGRIQAQLRHPNVVAVTDLIRLDGRIGLLMEYIDHETLEGYLRQRGALPMDEALVLMAPVMAGVTAAHDAGVLHRDLKPANILLARAQGGVIPKVADFGIAKVVADEIEGGGGTRQGVTMGTPGYLAPEQVVDSAQVDARADVFALGAILYEAIAGRMAFADPDGRVEVRSTVEREPPPLWELGRCDPVVGRAIHTALARQREGRFPDVRSFARALYAGHPSLLAQVEGQQVAGPLALGQPRTLDRLIGSPADAAAEPTMAVMDGEMEAPAASTPTPASEAGGQPVEALDPVPEGARGSRLLAWGLMGSAGAMALVGVLALGGAALVAIGVFGRGQDDLPVQVEAGHGLVGTGVEEGGVTPEGGEGDLPGEELGGPEPAEAEAPERGPGTPEGGPGAPEGGSRTPESGSAVADPPPAEAGGGAGDGAAASGSQVGEVQAVLHGLWRGTANDRPFEVRFTTTGEVVEGEASVAFGPRQRTSALRGRLDRQRGVVTLQERDGELVYEGELRDGVLSGTYGKPGAAARMTFRLQGP